MSITAPLVPMMSTCTEPAAVPSDTAPCALPSWKCRPLPATSASRPISEVPCSVCMAVYCAAMPLSVLLSCSMPLTVLICVICVVICALSIGLSGSWLFSWATSSFRKRSCAASALLAPVAALVAVVLPTAVPRLLRSSGAASMVMVQVPFVAFTAPSGAS